MIIDLDYVLNSRNVDNRIYLCDVRRFFSLPMGLKAIELRDRLMELFKDEKS